MKVLTLVAKGKNTCQALEKQLFDLLGDRVLIEGYYLEGGIKAQIGGDLIIASSPITLELAEKYLKPACPRIVALRAVNYEEMDVLLTLPPGTQALLVNDTLSAAQDTISFLNTIGIRHIEFFPYVPGITNCPFLDLAITPGETDLVPGFVKKVIDLKNRNIDFITLVEISKALNLLDEKANLLSAKYVSGMMNLLKKNKQMAEINQQMKNQLEAIINTVRDGIIALDKNGNVAVFNSIAEKLLECPNEKIIGKNYTDRALRKDIPTLLMTDDPAQANFLTINGRRLVLNSSLISNADMDSGRVLTLNDVTEIERLEEAHRRELVSRQYFARYSFANILGNSQLLNTTKNLALKIARSDSPILIQGQSGTGKELFAQSIHNASPRKKGPFVAVNFAELSENLLESELFGYEEGAFTGAKKGGMAGLFQQAHKGTIFLDEIGDAPLAFQVKLLRVLQEKQVRRIGSSRIIPIDVRVITATNKNLKELIDRGHFRQDLYYRLNVLPINIPPLRERKQDIMSLASHFYLKFFNRDPPLNENIFFSRIEEALMNYNWPGNIRELQNVVEYLANICPDRAPEIEFLPEELKESCALTQSRTDPGNTDLRDNLFNSSLLSAQVKQALRAGEPTAEAQTLPGGISLSRFTAELQDIPRHYRLIIKEIAEANASGSSIGRRSLAKKSGISEGVIRGIISELVKKNLLVIRRGRKGLYLSPTGFELYHHYLG